MCYEEVAQEKVEFLDDPLQVGTPVERVFSCEHEVASYCDLEDDLDCAGSDQEEHF